MLDRLNALREAAAQHEVEVQDLEPQKLDPALHNNDRELIMDFMSHMLATQRLLTNVQSQNDRLKDIANNQIYENTEHREIKKAQLETIIKDTKNDVNKIQQHLALMKNDITDSDRKFANEPETRVKKTVHRTFTQKFQNLVRASQQLQSEFKNSLNARVKGQIRVFNPNITDEELNEMKEDPEAATKLMMQQVMGPAHPQLKQTVEQIQNKFEAILRLEKSVNELFQLFQEMQILVKAQGEQIDNVESNLQDAENYLEKAEVHVEKAEDIHKGNKKRTLCLICCLIVVGIIFIVLLSGFIPF